MAVDKDRLQSLRGKHYRKYSGQGSRNTLNGSYSFYDRSSGYYRRMKSFEESRVRSGEETITGRGSKNTARYGANQHLANARQIRKDFSAGGQTMDKKTRYRMQRFYNGLSVG